ncbi:hypothetical protein KIKIMORA_01100 [Brevundimonas phage vB_BpoS-Kikimora]|uniref:Uncharacterized protein n=1 Tax=Brevundimonas phage vB_BpoS-Kikimora TaxID=2948601 RepID=A0A9E7MQZ1_9CAUD|nr:hypothetical protein KIKIMORA_01100 [Brevundimonas phage vB_BpoS-Kikimora]
MRMHIDPHWLREKIDAEPDDLSCEAGVLHPEAPIPAAISTLSTKSTDLDIMAVMEKIAGGAYALDHKSVFLDGIKRLTGLNDAILEALWVGATGESLP